MPTTFTLACVEKAATSVKYAVYKREQGFSSKDEGFGKQSDEQQVST